MDTEWNREKSLELIDLYRQKEELWNPNDNNYHMRNKKHDAWSEMAAKLNCDADVVKAKIASLLSSFRREKLKIRKTMGTGKGRKDVYISTWFAFKSFSFLLDKDKPKGTTDTENFFDNNDENDETSIGDETVEKDLQVEVAAINDETVDVNAMSTIEADKNETNGKQPKLFVSPKRPKKRNCRKTEDDPRVNAAYDILKSVSDNKDECSTYAAHIAITLRKFDARVRAIVMNQMDNIIFDAKMGKYNNTDSYTQPTYVNMNNASPSTLPSSSLCSAHSSATFPASPYSSHHASSGSSQNASPHASPQSYLQLDEGSTQIPLQSYFSNAFAD